MGPVGSLSTYLTYNNNSSTRIWFDRPRGKFQVQFNMYDNKIHCDKRIVSHHFPSVGVIDASLIHSLRDSIAKSLHRIVAQNFEHVVAERKVPFELRILIASGGTGGGTTYQWRIPAPLPASSRNSLHR